jgi:phage shock protein PspC (stress-responsive transcriptional regulator)
MNTTTTHPQASNSTDTDTDTDPEADTHPRQQPLFRPIHDRMLTGVASGVAYYFGIDVTLVRIVFAVLAVVGGVGVPLYLAGWLLIPDEGAEQSIASAFIQSCQTRSR